MDSLKWQKVLMEWVNCLNLCSPIDSIKTLKNKQFFEKLILLLTEKRNSSDNLETCLTLSDFLKRHYPACSLKTEPVYIQDISEICNICTLLLHFSCIVDGRDEFIIPLCKNLSHSSQVYIKLFLEEIQRTDEIKRDILDAIILNIFKYNTPSDHVYKSFFDVPKMQNTLLDYLKSPVRPHISSEIHQKEIKALQTQLKMERYEKADLQEELSQQFIKISQLDKQILEKQSEISKLKSELLLKEVRSPHYSAKNENHLETKLLKDEIVSLEKYVDILNKEQVEIIKERDKVQEKLLKTEKLCNEWKERAIQTEELNLKLSEEYELKLKELITYQEKCEELSSILEEYNSKNTNYNENDHPHNISGPIDYDSLAHTVVDIQLSDAQEENKHLKKQLLDLETNTQELTTHINQLQQDITNIMQKNECMNKQLHQKIVDSQIQYEEVKKELQLKNQEIETLKSEINSVKSSKIILTEKNVEMTNEVENLTRQIKNLDEELLQKQNEFDVLLNEKILSDDDVNNLCTDLENYLSSFKEQISEKLNFESDNLNNISKIQKYVSIIQDNLETSLNSAKFLEENCQKMSENIADFQRQIEKFNKVELHYKNEITNLNECLSDKETNLKILENENQNYKLLIEEKSIEINNLSTIKNMLVAKEQLIYDINVKQTKLAERLTVIESKLLEERLSKESLNETYQKTVSALHKKEDYIKVLEEKKNNLETELSSLTDKISVEMQNKAELNAKYMELQNIILNIEKQVCVLENDKENLIQKLKDLNRTMEKMKYEKDTCIDELLKQETLLNIQIEHLSTELENAESTNKQFISKLEKMNTTLNELTVFIDNLKLENAKVCAMYDSVKMDLLNEVNVKKEIENECKNLKHLLNEKLLYIQKLDNENIKIKDEISLLQNKLILNEEETKMKIDNQNLYHQNLINQIDTLNKYMNDTNSEILEMCCDLNTELKNEYEHELSIDENKIKYLRNCVCYVISERQELLVTTRTLQEELNNLNEICAKNEKSYFKTMNEVQENLLKTQKSLEELVNDYSSKLQTLQNSNKELQKENNDLKNNLDQLKNMENIINAELLSVKTELKETIINYKTSLETNNVLREEHEHSIIKLHDKLQKLTKIFIEIQNSNIDTNHELKSIIIDLNNQINLLTEEKDNLKVDNDKLRNNLTEITKNNEELIKIESIRKKKFEEFYELLLHPEEQFHKKLEDFDKNESTWNLKIHQLHENLKHLLLQNYDTMKKKNNEIEKLKFENEELLRNYHVLSNENIINIEDIKKLKKELEMITSDRNGDIEKLENANFELSEQLCLLAEDKSNTTLKMNKLHSELQELKLQMNDNNNRYKYQLQELEKEKNDVINRLEKSIQVLVEKDTEIGSLNTKVLKMTQEFEHLENNFNKEKNKLEKEIKFLESQITEIFNFCSDSYALIHNIYKRVFKTESTNECVDEINLLKSQKDFINALSIEKKIVYRESDDILTEILTKLNLLNVSMCENDELKKHLHKLKNDLSDLHLKNKALQNKITEKDVELMNMKQKYENDLSAVTISNKNWQKMLSENKIEFSKLQATLCITENNIKKYEEKVKELENEKLNIMSLYENVLQKYKQFSEKCNEEHKNFDPAEIMRLRSSCDSILEENTRLNQECLQLKKNLEERDLHLSSFKLIKDTYEKLLEENNKLKMELDTSKYKRIRDKEEYQRVMKEGNAKFENQVQEIRNDYEEKLRKMKAKVVKLYQEEKIKWQDGYSKVVEENNNLREKLIKKESKVIQPPLQEKFCFPDILNTDFNGSRASISSLKEGKLSINAERRQFDSLPRETKFSNKQDIEIEESVSCSKRRTFVTNSEKLDHALKMEDEEEIFSTKYLGDFSSEKFELQSNASSNRLLELQYRNSLCPAHLKSSYPAETQFTSPRRIKEDEIKMGAVDLDDSMSSSLLPGEKPRSKKDWGQTIYKKPGPPTPSKNGGRLSLQNNEVHPREVLREQNENRQIRGTSTPKRIKALFSRSSSKTTIEVGFPPRSRFHPKIQYEHSLAPLTSIARSQFQRIYPEKIRNIPKLIPGNQRPFTVPRNTFHVTINFLLPCFLMVSVALFIYLFLLF